MQVSAFWLDWQSPAGLNCPQTRVSKYELGTRRLDLLELRDVCKVLGVSVVDFVRTFDGAVSAIEAGEHSLKGRGRSGKCRSAPDETAWLP